MQRKIQQRIKLHHVRKAVNKGTDSHAYTYIHTHTKEEKDAWWREFHLLVHTHTAKKQSRYHLQITLRHLFYILPTISSQWTTLDAKNRKDKKLYWFQIYGIRLHISKVEAYGQHKREQACTKSLYQPNLQNKMIQVTEHSLRQENKSF